MLNRFCRKLGCLLGLLAILMATLAPTVSHALVEHHEAGPHPASHCATHSAHGNSPGDKATSHAMVAHLQACGYCNLLAHTPVLPSVESAPAVTVCLIEHRVAPRFDDVYRVEPLASALPRAPPVSF